jgi:ATP-dependent Lon protease
MSFEQVDLSLPESFDNVVRLFPLPNLVLFPGVIQALHLFEPRYRQLLLDAIAADELISMALFQPSEHPGADERPVLCETVCVGKIVTHAQLDDGRYNLLLLGVRRAKIVRELEYGTPYRMAEVKIVEEICGCSSVEAKRLREKVIAQFRQLITRRPQLDEESLEQLLGQKLPLGQLLDLIAYSSGVDPFCQQAVLEERDVCRRAEIVLAMLEGQIRKQSLGCGLPQSFPPGFSLN